MCFVVYFKMLLCDVVCVAPLFLVCIFLLYDVLYFKIDDNNFMILHLHTALLLQRAAAASSAGGRQVCGEEADGRGH